MATTLRGILSGPTGDADDEGHRTFSISLLVESDDGLDGPNEVRLTPGTPQPGDIYVVNNDLDQWAFCTPKWTAKPHDQKQGELAKFWVLERFYTTKLPAGGPGQRGRCNDQDIDDPLLEPPKISGSSTNNTEEIVVDRFGNAPTTSSHERMRGPQLEFPEPTDKISIEMNVASMAQIVFAYMMRNRVNYAPLWGFAARCVRLASVGFDVKYYGVCYKYYTLKLEFETNPNTFDRDILDEATKVLNGHWGSTDSGTGTGTGTFAQGDTWILDNIGGEPPDPSNPSHFIRAVDRVGNPMRIVLNGAGLPAEVMVSSGLRYMAVQASTGVELTDDSYWVAIVGGVTPQQFDPGQPYVTGNLVLSPDGDTYIAREDTTGVIPTATPVTSEWGLPIALYPNTISFAGTYNQLTAYTSGQYVSDSSSTGAGYIHVEKFNEANFLLLGIPTEF